MAKRKNKPTASTTNGVLRPGQGPQVGATPGASAKKQTHYRELVESYPEGLTKDFGRR